MKLSGWGRFRAQDCKVFIPRSRDELIRIVGSTSSLIARGNGRSYGDAAINQDATIIMTHLNRMIAFDPDTGVIRLESGVLLADLLDLVVPKGWFPLVTPGTKFVTIGGMMACDVHGKNHHRDGSFRQSVLSFTLVDGDGQIHDCSREHNSSLFDATLGGMGLTGVILDATLQLIPIESAYIKQISDRCENLDQLFDRMALRASEPYTVAWIDCTARRHSLGRGVLFSGRHAKTDELPSAFRSAPLQIAKRSERVVPFTAPLDLLHRPILKAFNTLYYSLNRSGEKCVDYDRYFYPLDAIAEWNRVYGPQGFVQFQCVVPKENGQAIVRTLLDTIAQSGSGSPLAVLKYLGRDAGGLSFPFEGYTLALDFPVRESTLALQDRLNAIVASEGGRLYFAKDATATRDIALKAYSADDFAKCRAHVSGSEHFRSALSRRIGLTS